MPDPRDDSPQWRTSTRSTGGTCVQVQIHPAEVRMRHSMDPTGPVLFFDTAAFRRFLDGVRGGEFDPPA